MLLRLTTYLAVAIAVLSACGSDPQAAPDAGQSATIEAAPATSAVAASTLPSTPPSTTPGPTPSTAASPLPSPSDTSTRPEEASTSTIAASGAAERSSSIPAATGTTSVDVRPGLAGSPGDSQQTVALRFESRVGDISIAELRDEALAILNDQRGWPRAGFTFVADDASPMRVVLAEGVEVDQLCLPLETFGTVSCQNGPVVALNADRWRTAVDHWDAAIADYRGYLVNHEVGHLLGQRHPKPRCPIPGRPAGVMEQQTGGLKGCTGNAWPRDWEIDLAAERPVIYAPLPDWGPDPVPANRES